MMLRRTRLQSPFVPKRRAVAARRVLRLALCAHLAVLGAAACGGGQRAPAPPPAKRFPVPLFDGLSLGMTRDETARAHPIRPALTSAGKNRVLWIYDRPGEYTAELKFETNRPDAKLERVDVHFGRNEAASQRSIQALSGTLGKPDVERRKAATNAYGDRNHDQFDTVWSDATQYVFLTERVPAAGVPGPTIYYVTVKKKGLVPAGPPTGYVPPPPPKGKDGKPVEEPAF